MSTTLPEPLPGVIGVGSYAQAYRHKRRWDAILTCEDPNTRERLVVTDRPQIVLAFEDCDDESFGYDVVTDHQVSQALSFMRQHSEGSILIHCYHGVDRSAAMALACLADRLGPGREVEAVAQLLTIRPESTPNLIAVAKADYQLNRDGALIAALTASEAADPVKLTARRKRHQFAIDNPSLYAKKKSWAQNGEDKGS